MKEDVAKRWSAALRSGKYTQMHRYLADSARKKHCCLGVLCELAIEDGVELAIEDGVVLHQYVVPKDGDEDEPLVEARVTTFSGGYAVLPREVQQWADVKSDTGRYECGSSLANLNDDGSTFNEIADVIDAEWERL